MPHNRPPLTDLSRVAELIVEDATALVARVRIEPSWGTVVGLMGAAKDLSVISAAMAVCLRRSHDPEDQSPYPWGL
jgi:hypothetical protein